MNREEKTKLFLDIDDTIYDTETYVMEKVLEKFGTSIVIGNKGVYDLMSTDERVRAYCDDLLSNYVKIPLMPYAHDCIKSLRDLYDIYFCSCYTFEREKKEKIALSGKYKVGIMLIEYNSTSGKSSVDLSDGILADNDVFALASCNAKRKIRVRGNGKRDVWSGEEVDDCFELLAKLLWEKG